MLAAEGVAPMRGLRTALSAIEAAARAGRAWMDPAPPPLLGRPLSGASATRFDEWQSKRMLAAHGLSVPPAEVTDSVEGAATAAARIGYPVVVKAVGAELVHKTEAGAVRLDVTDEATLREAAAGLLPISGRILVESRIDDAVAELIVGADRDPQFGPFLLVGFGGVLVELLGDTRVLLLPTSRREVRSALDGLRMAPLLDGYRGRPRADVDAAVEAILALADFVDANRDRVLEVDVNPLLVRPAGRGAVAVDAFVRMVDE
jgi:acyl-CoA synthetase (NDP forming)